MPLDNNLIESAVERYWREFDRYAKLAEFVGEACQKLLDTNVIRGSVQWRAKNPDRLRAKLQKYMATDEHAGDFVDLDSVFRVLKDLSGARITTYVETDRTKVVELLKKSFRGFGDSESVEAVVKDAVDRFYRATHCMVQLRDDDLVGRYQNLKGLGCEVQVCSLLAHVYNEIEHDLRYKPLSGALSAPETALLDGLGHLMKAGDTIINQTLDAVATRQRENTSSFEDEYDFVSRMRLLFPDATNFRDNAGQLFEVCSKLKLDSPDKIKEALNWGENTAGEGKTLAERLAAIVDANPATQLEIDPLSSDQLLLLLLKDGQRVEKLKEFFPSGRGIGRAPRFLSAAKQLAQMEGQQAEHAS